MSVGDLTVLTRRRALGAMAGVGAALIGACVPAYQPVIHPTAGVYFVLGLNTSW
jgi:hypothetical protein